MKIMIDCQHAFSGVIGAVKNPQAQQLFEMAVKTAVYPPGWCGQSIKSKLHAESFNYTA